MGGYATTFTDFTIALGRQLNFFDLPKAGVGLPTWIKFSQADLEERFGLISDLNISELELWEGQFADAWTPHLQRFLAGGEVSRTKTDDDKEIPSEKQVATAPVVMHVDATNGEGLQTSRDGSEDAPFRTIRDAQAAVRALSGSCREVTVLIHPGTYTAAAGGELVDGPWLFGPEDGGCLGAPIVYRAAQAGTVQIDGGVRVSAASFKPVPNAPYMVAPLPRGVPPNGPFQSGWQNCTGTSRTELFFGKAGQLQPMIEARHPDVGSDGNWRWMRQGATLNSTSFLAGTEGGSAVDPNMIAKWASPASLRGLYAHGFWKWAGRIRSRSAYNAYLVRPHLTPPALPTGC